MQLKLFQLEQLQSNTYINNLSIYNVQLIRCSTSVFVSTEVLVLEKCISKNKKDSKKHIPVYLLQTLTVRDTVSQWLSGLAARFFLSPKYKGRTMKNVCLVSTGNTWPSLGPVFALSGVQCAVTTWPTGTTRRMGSCTVGSTTGRSSGSFVTVAPCSWRGRQW